MGWFSGAGKLLQSALSVVLQNMRSADVAPNNITYSILLEACDKYGCPLLLHL